MNKFSIVSKNTFMGQTLARSDSKVYQDIVQAQIQKCPNYSCQNVIGDVEIVAEGGDIQGLRITQQCTISGECVFDGLMDNLSKAIQKNSSVTEGGLGISISLATSIAHNRVQQIQKQDCGTITSENIAGDVSFRAVEGGLYDITFEQIADQKQKCLFKSMSKSIAELESDTAAKASGFDPTALGAIIAVVIVIGALLYFGGGKNDKKGGTGATIIKIIIGIIIVVAAAAGIDCFWLKWFICKD